MDWYVLYSNPNTSLRAPLQTREAAIALAGKLRDQGGKVIQIGRFGGCDADLLSGAEIDEMFAERKCPADRSRL